MEGSQQFRLKWNNYHVNITNSFDSLRLDEDFVDVTVACDGFQTKAHRMVLSACSPYFRELLKSNPHPHPIVILRDVDRRHLELLLDYMYHGEVNVAQAHLADFLKVAEMLKVKGLADDRPSNAPADPTTNGRSGSESPAAPAVGPPEKRRRRSPPAGRAMKREPSPEPDWGPEAPEPEPAPADGLSERLPDGPVPSPSPETGTGQPGEPGPSLGASYDTGQESPLAQDPVTRLMSCPHCTHLSNNYGKLKAHIGKVHFPVPVTCADCGKVCKNKYAMQVHKSKYHRRTWKTVPSAPRVPSPVGWSLQPAGGGPGTEDRGGTSAPGQGGPLGPGQGGPIGPGQGGLMGPGSAPGPVPLSVSGGPMLSVPAGPLVSGAAGSLASGPMGPLASIPAGPEVSGPFQGPFRLPRDELAPPPVPVQGSPLTLGEVPGPVLVRDSAPPETQQKMDVPSPSAGLDLTRKPALNPGQS
ncbi:protein bric-a-brac 1-like isoform X1 [Amphibalanus amphitrite]|uniref:protein bric-a-brac 1-like isoform X1 n=1 Tax=Amphibalanus amphitrite TaxID=1232801 RepID=UPI001C929AEC|nr:protein bric-a-brac 1-like isoform X1 [Amphibalanus amphitrite]